MQKGLDLPMRDLQQQGSVRGSDSVVLVHSSDLHINATTFGDSNDQDAVTVLRCVIDAANEFPRTYYSWLATHSSTIGCRWLSCSLLPIA